MAVLKSAENDRWKPPHKIDDNLNFATPFTRNLLKISIDLENHNNYNIAKFQPKIRNVANAMEETINPV